MTSLPSAFERTDHASRLRQDAQHLIAVSDILLARSKQLNQGTLSPRDWRHCSALDIIERLRRLRYDGVRLRDQTRLAAASYGGPDGLRRELSSVEP